MSSPSHASSPVDIPEYNTQFEPGPNDDETLWNVLEIVKEDKNRYMVKWEGIDPDTGKPWDLSWVPKRDCTDDLIYEWKVTKARKALARKTKRKSKGTMASPDIKSPSRSHEGEKKRSNAGSSTSSHNPSSIVACPSGLRLRTLSGTVRPVIELVRHKKRLRESCTPDRESELGFVTENVPHPKKKGMRVANQSDAISHSPDTNDKPELSPDLGLLSSRPGVRDISIASNVNGMESYDSGISIKDTNLVPESGALQAIPQIEHGCLGLQHNEWFENGVVNLVSQSRNDFPVRYQQTTSKKKDKPPRRDALALRSNDLDSMGEGQRESDQDETDEVVSEDALDARELTRRSGPTNIHSSAEVNFSLEANAALTQQFTFRPPVIASPVRELNHALGLLNRKSEEIELLKVTLKDHQSRTAELDEELLRLKRNLEVTEERYEEVNTALSKERDTEESEEKRVEESTANDLTTSSFAYPDRFMELCRDQEQLKLAKAQLESDTDMLRKLYAQASDAHQIRVMEIKTLKRDNDSLREQATTGVKQAQMFFATQIRKLEKELTHSRGAVEVLTDQARRTDDDVRRRAALLPMAQRETEIAKQEVEHWKTRFMELGRENTRLRLKVKEWEDEAMTRQSIGQESALEDELVWMCSWMDTKHGTKCGALLESREKLHEHLYEAGHI